MGKSRAKNKMIIVIYAGMNNVERLRVGENRNTSVVGKGIRRTMLKGVNGKERGLSKAIGRAGSRRADVGAFIMRISPFG